MRATHRGRRFAGDSGLPYLADVSAIIGPEQLVEKPIPDLRLPSSTGGIYALRGRVGVGPLVLFFYVHNGTPG
jgi:hypothetical protein